MARSHIAVMFLAACSANAQQAAPAFEAASVKLNHSASNSLGGNVGIGRGGKLSMRNVPVRELIKIAYNLADYQLSRGPAWTASAGYDVEAKPEKSVSADVARVMMQNMLAERFQLRVHHENPAVAGFNLVVDKGGSKLRSSDAPGIGFGTFTREEIQGPADMPMLARVLSQSLRAPVEDRTGIAGKYDIHVKWSRDDNGNVTPDEPTMSIFAALKLQLGLSLETSKVPIDLLVIDRLERPTEN